MTVTRRQHHVWRSYLEAWANDDKIFCLQGGRIFNSNVVNVAVERDFYKLHVLTDADLQAIRLLFGNSQTPAKKVVENFIYMLGFAGRLKANLPPTGDPSIASQLNRYIIMAEEDFHARLERDIKPVFDAIRRKDLSFYNDPEICGLFTHFLCLQNLRTKGVRERFLAAERKRPSGFGKGFSAERCWNIIAHCVAVNAGGSLMLERTKRPLVLLENDTSIPFITGDQPVVNLLGASPGEMPRLLAFYYPVSPHLAVILDEVHERTGFGPGKISDKQAEILNDKIQQAAHKQTFASSPHALEPFAQTL